MSKLKALIAAAEAALHDLEASDGLTVGDYARALATGEGAWTQRHSSIEPLRAALDALARGEEESE